MLSSSTHTNEWRCIHLLSHVFFSFEWNKTMRKCVFVSSLNKRKCLLIIILWIIFFLSHSYTLQCDKMTKKNDNEIYSIYIFAWSKNKRAKNEVKTKNGNDDEFCINFEATAIPSYYLLTFVLYKLNVQLFITGLKSFEYV